MGQDCKWIIEATKYNRKTQDISDIGQNGTRLLWTPRPPMGLQVDVEGLKYLMEKSSNQDC